MAAKRKSRGKSRSGGKPRVSSWKNARTYVATGRGKKTAIRKPKAAPRETRLVIEVAEANTLVQGRPQEVPAPAPRRRSF